MKNILLTLVIATFAIPVFAQTNWQGHVNYTISVSGNDQAAQMMSGSTSSISVKDSMVRTDNNLGMFQTKTIINSIAKKGNLLVDVMGNKYIISLSSDDIKEINEKGPDYDVKYDDSTKLIAGQVCKKAIVTMKKDKSQFTAWYVPDIKIPIYSKYMYSKIDGLPLVYEIEAGPIVMHYTCTSIDNKPVDASDFTIPDGYTPMSMDQFKSAMGGMSGH
jgi:GLPGLI family protein